jgi:hypothetical protein
MILGFLVLQAEKAVILTTIFVLKDAYILIKEELMVATIEQINSVVQIGVMLRKLLRDKAVPVAVLQHIVIAGEEKEGTEIVVLVITIMKVTGAEASHKQHLSGWS